MEGISCSVNRSLVFKGIGEKKEKKRKRCRHEWCNSSPDCVSSFTDNSNSSGPAKTTWNWKSKEQESVSSIASSALHSIPLC